MNDEILWLYVGDGLYIDGVPARDLTAADWLRLGEVDRSAVEHSGLYRRAARVRAPVVVADGPEVVELEAAESPAEPVVKTAEDGPRKWKRGQAKE